MKPSTRNNISVMAAPVTASVGTMELNLLACYRAVIMDMFIYERDFMLEDYKSFGISDLQLVDLNHELVC